MISNLQGYILVVKTENKKPLLNVENLSAGYANHDIIHKISLDIFEGEIVGVFGHNGSGKSTFFKSVIGLLKNKRGIIRFNGQEILSGNISDNIKLGIGIVPQNNNVFPNLSVYECLQIASLKKEQFLIEHIISDFPILRNKQNQKAGSLSGGEQQVLALAMTLQLDPKILLLDEPTAGLSPNMAKTVMELIDNLNKNFNKTIIIIEQNVYSALAVVERAIIFRHGEIVFDHPSSKLKNAKNLWDYF